MRMPLTNYFCEQQKLLAATRCHFLVAGDGPDGTGGHLPVYGVGRLTDFIGGFLGGLRPYNNYNGSFGSLKQRCGPKNHTRYTGAAL